MEELEEMNLSIGWRTCQLKQEARLSYSGPYVPVNYADLATERERQLTTARANQTTGLTNGWAANWALEVDRV